MQECTLFFELDTPVIVENLACVFQSEMVILKMGEVEAEERAHWHVICLLH